MVKLKDMVLMQWSLHREDMVMYSFYPPTQWEVMFLLHGKSISAELHFANPCFTQIRPTCIPVSGEHQSKLTLMSESLRNDGRIWVPKKLEDVESIRAGKLKPIDIEENDRDYYLERRYPAFETWFPEM